MKTLDPAMEMEKLPSHSEENFDIFMGYLTALYARDGSNTVIAVDTETNAEDIRDGRGYGIGISIAIKLLPNISTVYIPVRHDDSENNVSPERVQQLALFFKNFDGIVVFHNAKFDLVSLRTMGIKYTGRFYCTMLMVHLLNENLMSKSLNSCVATYLGKGESKKDDAVFKELIAQLGWGGMPYGAMLEYAAYDAELTLRLFFVLLPLMQREGIIDYWENHKMDFHGVIIAMESRGILIDQELSRAKAQIGTDRMVEIQKELEINPGSPKGLKQLLIDELGLPVVKLTKAGLLKKKNGEEFDPYDYASFDKEAMEVYDQILDRDENPTAKLVSEFRGWQKTVSSNYRAYLRLVSPDGRLRPNYKLHGTRTGRMSCEMPNLQQIPRESEKEWNGDLKKAFIPTPGYQLWEFDYSQLELRLATAYADEKELKKVFAEGRDIFTEMSAVLGFTRQDTKTFVYSVQYGAGLDRIAAVFKTTRADAEDKRQRYRDAYPGFRKVEAIAAARCKAVGKVQLWSKRYRHFWDKKNDAHKAFNSAIQGGAADIVEHVMVRLFQSIDDETTCRMLLQVHDSVVFEIREDVVEDVVPEIERIMSDVQPDFGVTFAVKGKIWGSKE